jgi:tRNA1Val (adenine37-N6)-methyltransferase
MNNVFHFKHFSIHHGRTIMKVGTDGVLLGAYVDVTNVKNILDIGTGSGLIAIMFAQRCNAKITGIEIDKNSAEEAKENISQCPWHDRILIRNISFQEFILENAEMFDLIVCNPPFFSGHLRSPDENRNLVRHNIQLNYNELLKGAKQLLSPEGIFWLIIPCSETAGFIEIAGSEGFHLIHQLNVIPKEGKKAHRNIIAIGKKNNESFSRAELTIRNHDDSFTNEYKNLTGSFYLNF